MGLPVETHDALYADIKARLEDKTLGPNMSYYHAVPGLARLFAAPGLVSTIDNILVQGLGFRSVYALAVRQE